MQTRCKFCDSVMTRKTIDTMHFTKQNPSWEADSVLADQEISHLKWSPNVLYGVQHSSSQAMSSATFTQPKPSVLFLRPTLTQSPNRACSQSNLSSSGFPTNITHAFLFTTQLYIFPFLLLCLRSKYSIQHPICSEDIRRLCRWDLQVKQPTQWSRCRVASTAVK
jgi:hypothetical protein